MDVVPLSLAKMHLRVIGDAENELIQHYIGGATSYIKKYLNRTSLPGEDESPQIIEKDVQDAALLLIADMYEFREAKFVGQNNAVTENPAVVAKLYPYRLEIGI